MMFDGDRVLVCARWLTIHRPPPATALRHRDAADNQDHGQNAEDQDVEHDARQDAWPPWFR